MGEESCPMQDEVEGEESEDLTDTSTSTASVDEMVCFTFAFEQYMVGIEAV